MADAHGAGRLAALAALIVPKEEIAQRNANSASALTGGLLARAIARARGLATLGWLAQQKECADPCDLSTYVHERFLPWAHLNGRLIVAVEDLSAELSEWLRARYGPHTEFRVIARGRLDGALEDTFASTAVTQAAFALRDTNPTASAARTMTRAQIRTALALTLACAVALILAPEQASTVAVLAIAMVNVAVVAFRLILALLSEWVEQPPEMATSAPANFPRYSVLVPLYREAHMVAPLLQALDALDYPLERLEIFIIGEADDLETLDAARAAVSARPQVRVLAAPDVGPRTKPKALNYGLAFARGELIVVYDAEDRPEPDQLRKAAARFADGAGNLGCLQARLNFFNQRESWLTRLFTLEYALWFDHLLPGLERLKAPIPLGGTSNHFKRVALDRAGGWDPFNVTEDADLGLRLMRSGFTVGTLGSTTYEEATHQAPAWVRQRSRWIKGYMQTWLVQMRDPCALWRDAGPMGFIAFQLFVGGVVATALVNPILWSLSASWALAQFLGLHVPLSFLGGDLAFASFVAGNGLLIYLSLLSPLRRGWLGLAPWAVTVPAYWLLQSLAGYKALWQLITKPFYWEKTHHGRKLGAAP